MPNLTTSGLMSGAKAPHHNPPGIFFACYESRKIGLAEYEPFMGTFLHLKLDTLSIKGLYFDYLGPDWISAKELSNGRVTLREPFNNLHVTFTGPWTSTCQCVNEEAKTETCPLSDNQQSETVHEQLALAVGRRI